MKMRHWFSGAALFGVFVLAALGLWEAAVVLYGLSSLIELVVAMVNDKNTNV